MVEQSIEQGYFLKLGKLILVTLALLIASPIVSTLFLIVIWGIVLATLVGKFWDIIYQIYEETK